jgi:ABC-2 type transport system permease protein
MDIRLRKPKLNFSARGIMQILVDIGSSTLSQIFVLVIVLVGINLLSQKFFLRIDLTESNTYTLSEGTKNIVSSTEDQITIKTYFSDNLPPEYTRLIKNVNDMLDEYVRHGNGKLNLERVDPDNDDFKSQAQEAGITETPFGELSEDKVEVASGYLGLTVEYKDNKETIKRISDTGNFEYDVTSRIYKLITDEKPTIGFLTGHGEKATASEYSIFTEYLETQFTVEQVSLTTGKPIDPEQIKVLVIAAPKSAFSQRDLFEIEQYVLRGGRLLVLAESFEYGYQDPPLLMPSENNLNELLENFGLSVKKSVILDESYYPLYGIVYYPFWINTLSENFDTDNPVFSQQESIVFYWASPLENKSNDDQNFTSLVKTTDQAWDNGGEFVSISPQQEFTQTEEDQFTVVAMVEGKFTSMFEGQKIPDLKEKASEETQPDTLPDLEEPAEEVKDERTKEDERVEATEDGRIVVIGDSELILDDLIMDTQQNALFLSNLIEWLSGSDELLAIRARSNTVRPLEVTSDGEKNFYKAMNIGLVPVLLIGAGVGYNVWRKKRRSLI